MKKKFTKVRFLKLEIEAQHKKCAESLRKIYKNKLIGKEDSSFDIYKEFILWMGLENLELDPKKIANRYHFHLKNAKMSLKEHNFLPSLRTLDRKTPKIEFSKNAIYLDNIRSAYNVGNILRTTEALRIGSVYFAKNTPFIDNKKVIKTAQGAASVVPCFQNIELKDLPRPIIALDTSTSSIDIFDFIFPKKFTIILGNEEYGISDESLAIVDYLIEIPMLGIKNSINVSSAYAICAAMIRGY